MGRWRWRRLEKIVEVALLQLGELRLGLLVNGDIEIGISPEGEEIVAGSACRYLVAHYHLRVAERRLSA